MAVTSLTTCLWFDGQAEEAAELYTSVFKDSKITGKQRYPETGSEVHGQKPGSVMVVQWEIGGQRFVGLNGGPMFKHSAAVSFQIDCDSQDEVDYHWQKLGEGGDESRQQCGWLADRFGISWQVVPKVLKQYLSSDDKDAAGRVNLAMLGMKKLEIDALKKAYEGK